MPVQKSKRSRWSNPWLIPAIILVIIAVGATAYVRHHDKSKSVSTTKIQTNNGVATPTTNVPGGSPSSTASGIGQSKGPSSGSSSSISSGVTPGAPIGNFVSNHRPNLSGSPSPNAETSNCTTTPGATCQIEFTMGSTTRSLAAQTTDASGNTAWYNWTLQSIGLTGGTWHVTAVAANGDKTVTAKDVNALVVSP